LCALALVPGCWSDPVERRFDKGQKLLFENRHEDAESHFLAFARDMVDSQRADARRWRARALYQAGRIDHLYLDRPRRAVQRLRQALKLLPEGPFAFDARREIADIYYDRLMDYRTAALEYERLVHEFAERDGIDGYQYRVAQSYFLVRDFDQARTEARMLLDKWPQGRFAAEARLLIANSYYLEQRLDDAVAAHQTLLDSGPDVPLRARSLFELGICYQDLGQMQKAEEAYLTALKDHPRPDLVQIQLSALRERLAEEDEKAKPLSYATARGAPRGAGARAEPEPRPKSKPKPKPKPQPKSKPEPGAAPEPDSASGSRAGPRGGDAAAPPDRDASDSKAGQPPERPTPADEPAADGDKSK
jgi:tetratricopeptide (TPR) repeat protein